MTIFRTFVLVMQLLQDADPCLPPGEETAAEATVIIKVLQQADRIPPEFGEEARDKLGDMNVDVLPLILKGMHDQSEHTIELLLAAGDSIVNEAVKDSVTLPLSYLEKFAAHEQQQPEARRAALRWADLQDPGVRELFLSQHLNDDVFRQEAVEAAIAAAKRQLELGHAEVAKKTLHAAFDVVQSPEHAIVLAAELKQLKVDVPLTTHLGVISQWRAIGPFPWTASDEFAKERPPEQQKNTEESCSIDDQTLSWTDIRSDQPGVVQLLGSLAPGEKDSVAYAQTTINLESAQNLEMRVAAIGRLEVRVNDKTLITGDSDWTRLHYDQVSVPVTLNAGKNHILIKLGAMRRDTAPDAPIPPAQFSVRFVDSKGRGVDFGKSQ
jgi:hypothetical protein